MAPGGRGSLPFPDRTFDVVVCEFGLMFFPDKAAGVREAFRVLRPGGVYLFNVWDERERNAATRIAHDTIGTFFPDDPPQFYEVPFNLHDPAGVRGLLAAGGFVDVAWETVAKVGTSPSAEDAAAGLVEGNPVIGAIMARRPDALPDIRAAVARNIAAELGDHPVRTPLRAHVFTARRPGVRPLTPSSTSLGPRRERSGSQSQGLTPCLGVTGSGLDFHTLRSAPSRECLKPKSGSDPVFGSRGLTP